MILGIPVFFGSNSNQQPENQAIRYTIEWSTSDTEETDIFSINFESMQAVSCLQGASNVVFAGHSLDVPNLALIKDIAPINVLEQSSVSLQAELEEPQYCAFHITIGSTGSEDVPSVEYNSADLSFSTDSAFGHRHEFESAIDALDLEEIHLELDIAQALKVAKESTPTQEPAIEFMRSLLEKARYSFE